MDHQCDGGGGNLRQHQQVLLGVVGHLGVQKLVDEQRSAQRHHHVVAIGRRLGDLVRAQHGRCTGLVFHNDGLAQLPGHGFCQHACDDVGRTTGVKGHDKADGLAGIVGLGPGRQADQAGTCCRSRCCQDVAACCGVCAIHVVVSQKLRCGYRKQPGLLLNTLPSLGAVMHRPGQKNQPCCSGSVSTPLSFRDCSCSSLMDSSSCSTARVESPSVGGALRMGRR